MNGLMTVGVKRVTVGRRGVVRAWQVIVAGLLAMLLAGSACAQTGFLYVLNDSTAGNAIYGFSVDESTGSLVALPGFPVATGGLGNGNTRSEELFYDRANSRLFAINVGSSTVGAFSADATTGALTALPYSPIVMPGPSVPGTWACLSIHPSGSPLVVGDRDNFRVASFNVSSTAATLINTASTASEANLANAFSCAFSRDGNYFYTGGNSATFAKFSGFSVDSGTGALSPLIGSPFAGGFTPEAYATDTQGRLFLTTNGTPSSVIVHTTSSGIPTVVTSTQSGLTNGTHGLLHPSGFYMVADRSGNRIGVYSIAGSGASTKIAPVAGSPFASGGSFTDVLALNQSGNFLFAANGNSRNISVFSVNGSTGALTSALVQPGNTIGTTGQIVGMAYAPPSIGSRPNPFGFTPQTGVAIGATAVSNTVTITGIGAAVPISIGGGEYSVDGGAFTSAAGNVSNGQTVTVRLTASSTYSTTTSAILTIGVVTGSFSVSTQQAAATAATVTLLPFDKLPDTPVPILAYFYSQAVGTTSAAQTLTLANNGTATLNISGLSITGDFAQATTCGSTLASGAKCTISVTFTPTAEGYRTGMVSIASNDANSPHTLPLSGTGTVPLLLTVTNLNDAGAGSLRDAIAQANGNPGADTINFAAGLQGTITLTTGQISIIDALSINGPGALALSIDGNANKRIFSIYKPSSQVDISPDFLVALSGLTLTNGKQTNESGGAIRSYKSLALSNMVLTGNQAINGGALAFFPENDAALTISDSTLSNNTAVNTAAAGDGYGGALRVLWRYFATKSTVTVTNSRIENNVSDNSGGGMHISTSGLIKVSRTVLVGNQTKTLTAFSGNRTGGAISAGMGDFVMEESEVSGNVAAGNGGGLNFWQQDPNLQTPATTVKATVTNCTISGNSAGGTAGAIQLYGNVILSLNASTVVNNSAPTGATAGVRIATGATIPASVPPANVVDAQLDVVSSIAWNNLAGTKPVDISRATNFTTVSTPITVNSSLAGAISSSLAVTGTGNMLGIDPRLGALANSGGTTQSHLPQTGSPALGSGACISGVVTDQRGAARPLSGCDMGAVELASAAQVSGAPTAVVAMPGNRRASISFTAPSSDGGAPITSYTVTPSSGGNSTTGTTSPVTVTGLTNGTAYTFTVTATNEAGRSGASAVSNSVTPVVSTVSLSSSSLSFANQAQGATSAAQTITLTNTGAATVAIGSIAVSGDFASTNTCGTSLAAGANCTISITFTPTTTDSLTGSLSIVTDAVGSPSTVALDGIGGGASISLTLAQGWNLLGNSLNQILSVASLLGDRNAVTTVWKWDAVNTTWQFYTPQMDAVALQTYAAGKGYGVLNEIRPGEGYWVNAKAQLSLGTQTGAPLNLTAANLVTGWNLVATGQDVSPAAFNQSLSATLPVLGTVPLNLTTLWAWDNPASAWYFYAPSLEAQGGTKLIDYITGKGYFDFTQRNKTLGNGMGFWVNR